MSTRAGWTALALAMLAACKDKPAPPPAPTASTPPAASSVQAKPQPSARSVEKDEAAAERRDAGTEPGELEDVGPAGPATASARGVVMITKDNRLVLARLGKKGSLEPVTEPAEAFRATARGPAIAGDYVYWTADGRLVRQGIAGGAREPLADDARDGTRVAAAVVGSGKSARAVAAYIARAGDATAAKLWIERVGTWTLTPEGAAATSVALAASGTDVVAASLEGRTGMTPVHARRIDFAHATPSLKEDVVAWVAGPAQSLTEIAAAASGDSVWAFVPLERDITRFGMAQVQMGVEPQMGSPVTWRAYPNGLDPAPIAAVGAAACGAAVLYAVPVEAKPRAPQELHLATLGSSGLSAPEVVARSRAFFNVSLAEAQDGLLVSYVADHRTWARLVRCSTRR